MKIMILFLLFIPSLFCHMTIYSQTNDANNYLKLAEKFSNEQQFLKAAKLYEKYLSIQKKMNEAERIQILHNIGTNYRDAGEFSKAQLFIEKGLILARKIQDDTSTAQLLNNYGELYNSFGENDSALTCYQNALAIFVKLDLKRDAAIVLNNIGTIYNGYGQYNAALKYYMEALELNTELNNKEQIATNLNNIGDVHISFGKYKKAITYLEESLKINTELKLEYKIPTILSNIASIYYLFGQYDKSISYLKESLTINKKLDQKDKIIIRLNNLGVVYVSNGQYTEAINCLKEALSAAKKIKYKDQIPTILNGLGGYYDKIQQYNTAIKYYQEALQLNKVLGKEDQIGNLLNNIGNSYMLLNKYEKAQVYFKKALQSAKKFGIEYDMTFIYRNMGILYFNKGDYEKAIDNFNLAIGLLEKIRNTASGDARRDYLASKIMTYRYLISSYLIIKNYGSALNTLEQSSARYLNELIGKRMEEDSIKIVNIDSFHNTLPEHTMILYFSSLNSKMELVRFIIKKDTISASEENTIALTKEIDSVNSELILSFLKQKYPSLKDNKLNFNQILFFYNYILSKPNPGISEINIQKELSKLLYNFLFANIENSLKNIDNLIIIPGGNLALIPFEALLMPDGKYLVEKYNIKYIQSLTVSKLLSERNYNNNRKSILAFGGAVYDSLSYDVTMIESEQHLRGIKGAILSSIENNEKLQESYFALGYGNIPNLPGTLTEVNEIKNIFDDCKVITGNEVNESNIKTMSRNKDLKNYKAIHFATHGISIPDIPELSALILSQTGDNENEDGFLTMQEIANLELNSDFVNLSACETGHGKIYNGEGIVGLTQAFLTAGSNGISVSLWEVEDKSTMEFMVGLYRIVKEKGISYDNALNEIKREFIKNGKYGQPFYWAPFVYWGK